MASTIRLGVSVPLPFRAFSWHSKNQVFVMAGRGFLVVWMRFPVSIGACHLAQTTCHFWVSFRLAGVTFPICSEVEGAAQYGCWFLLTPAKGMVRITPVAKVTGDFLCQLHGWKALFDEPVNCQQISLDK